MKGWIKSIRESKGLTFVAITDGSRDHQLTVKDGTPVEGELKLGASFEAEGCDSVTPRGFPEFLVSKLKIVGYSDDTYPIQPKQHTFDYLRTILPTRGRTKTFAAIWKIRHHLTQGIHRTLEDMGFYQYYTPIITSADCEGAGETFDAKSDWMSEKLTVSSQLHGEVGMMSLGKIYTFSPCFRAEKSTGIKHLSEFWMIEPEAAFYDLEKTMSLAEDLIYRCITIVLSKCEYEYKQLELDTKFLKDILLTPFPRIKYETICHEFGLKWGFDIGSDLEKKIVAKYKSPVFITHYPKELKPFYMHKDDKVAYCFDLIFPDVGELVGGSEREPDYEKLKTQMLDAGLDLTKMDWYLSTRKWGSVPHAGFGLGFERFLMFITKVPKIHDTIPFPISY